MILSAARSRIRKLLDDTEAERYLSADIDAVLTSAQYEALLWACASASGLFTLEASVTTSAAGVADLTAISPLKIASVAALDGTTRTPIKPSTISSMVETYAAAQALKIAYVPRPTFPATDAAAFVWGTSAVVCPPVDSYMCLVAAGELKVTEGEQLAGLETRKAELKEALSRLIAIPSFSVMPMGGRSSTLVWVMTAPNTLQLAYA